MIQEEQDSISTHNHTECKWKQSYMSVEDSLVKELYVVRMLLF